MSTKSKQFVITPLDVHKLQLAKYPASRAKFIFSHQGSQVFKKRHWINRKFN